MQQLPDELILQIFLHVDSHDVDQKYRLSQVCSRWRRVALNNQRLWNRFCIMTPQDGERLSTLVERSGSAALDIELFWYFRYKEQMLTADECIAAVQILIACRNRIRRLFIDVSRADPKSLSKLVSVSLDFPMLQELKFKCGEFDRNRLRFFISAPQLKRIDMYKAGVSEWESLFVSSLEHLDLVYCEDAAVDLMDTILSRCGQLQSLTLTTGPFGIDFLGLRGKVAELVPQLKSLDVCADAVDLVTLFRTGFRDVVLDHLAVTSYNGFVDDDMKALMAEVLRGMDSLQFLNVVDDQEVRLQDGCGRTRQMGVWNDDSSWEWPALWVELATRYGAHKSVKTFCVRSCDWNELAGALRKPLPEATNIELRVVLTTDVIDSTYNFMYEDPVVPEDEKAAPGLRKLFCPTLRRMVFIDSEDYKSNCSGPRVDVIRRLLRAVDMGTNAVEVCVSEAGLAEWEANEFHELLFTNDMFTRCSHCPRQRI